MPFLMFYLTHPDEATARRIADHLVHSRLAACANIFPITSAYWWEGAVQGGGEWMTVVKTRLSLEDRLEAEVRKLHPYAVPCILRFEVRANADYEYWIMESTGTD